VARRSCALDGCRLLLPAESRPDKLYCTKKHRATATKQRKAARERGEPVPGNASVSYKDASESLDGRGKARRGPSYRRFVQTGWAERLMDGEQSQKWVAGELGENPGTISRWMAAYRIDRSDEAVQEAWDGPSTTVEEALEDFGAFCRRYWPDDQVTAFHMEWAEDISEAVDTGGRTMLLAAQRHGKSQMLRKYCTWRIAKDPDIRIMWVSQTADLAKRSVGYVLDILGGHVKMAEEILGPGKEFRPPPRNNMAWTAEEFTVGTRTKIQASPTMVAIGKGGSILSRDADVIIVDDMQEHKHVRSPSVRTDDIDWFFTDLMSRKLPATGMAVIGSRQHLQDVYSEILKRADDWTVKVYPVHDPLCTVDEDDHKAHDSAGCMLWPDQYPHAYMQEQRGQQGEPYFQRNMMNNPKNDAAVLVSASDIERCRDRTRVMGQRPDGVTRLIAGIDPAETKPVAGVLWGFEPGFGADGRRHLIDTAEAEAGIRGGRHILELWRRKYGCTLFVVEKNMAQSWWLDTTIRDFCSREGVQIRPHYTSRVNKWDDAAGVTAMFSRLRTDPPTITLPYGDRDTQKKSDRVAQTFLNFDPDFTGNKHADDDLVMAAWFSHPTMDTWSANHTAKAVVEYMQTGYGRRTPSPTRLAVPA